MPAHPWIMSYRFKVAAGSTDHIPLAMWVDCSAATRAYAAVRVDDFAGGTLTVGLVTSPVLTEQFAWYETCESVGGITTDKHLLLRAVESEIADTTFSVGPMGVLGISLNAVSAECSGLLTVYLVQK